MSEEKTDSIAEKDRKKSKKASAKKASVWVFIGIVALVIALFYVKANYQDINDYFNPLAKPPIVHNLTAADVQLYKYDALSSNTSMTAEVWIINLGEKPAVNITVFVRARNQTGAILLERNISLTSLVLRENETCTGVYSISYTKKTKEIFSTIEVKWDSGRHSYQKETLI